MNGTVCIHVSPRRNNHRFLSLLLSSDVIPEKKMPLMVLQNHSWSYKTPITTGKEKQKRHSYITQSVCIDTHEIHWSLIFAVGIHLEHSFPHVLLPAGLRKRFTPGRGERLVHTKTLRAPALTEPRHSGSTDACSQHKHMTHNRRIEQGSGK